MGRDWTGGKHDDALGRDRQTAFGQTQAHPDGATCTVENPQILSSPRVYKNRQPRGHQFSQTHSSTTGPQEQSPLLVQLFNKAMSCKCGGSCDCGSDCKCGRNPSLGFSEAAAATTSARAVISGVAPVKMHKEEMPEVSAEGGHGCKCGSSCSCDPCNC